MQKLFALAASLLLFIGAVDAQTTDTLEQSPVLKGAKDAAFHKVFSEIIASAPHYFKSLQTDNGIKSISDTSYNLKFNFRDKNDATLICEKSDVNLTIDFNLDNAAFTRFFRNLSAELPPNYVYTREYDALAKQSNYTFFAKPGTKTIPADFPEKISMITDASNNVLLTFLLFR